MNDMVTISAANKKNERMVIKLFKYCLLFCLGTIIKIRKRSSVIRKQPSVAKKIIYNKKQSSVIKEKSSVMREQSSVLRNNCF